MRRLLSACAILVAAVGLVWLVRLGRSAPANPPSDAESGTSELVSQPASGLAENRDDLPSPETTGGAPAVVLGRIGGTLPDTLVDPRLLVEKSRRTLTVFSDGMPVKTYRVALSRSWVGDKEREGDRRIPEGDFYVCSKNDASKYHLALGLSYPNEEDAERGLASGLITKREHRAIVDAVKHYRRPPWNTKLGGEIMVHGGGTATDWTTGCVALSDDDIEELYPLLPLGTEVEIRP